MIGRYRSPGLVRSADTTLDHLNPFRPGSTLTYSKNPLHNHQRRSTRKDHPAAAVQSRACVWVT